MLVLLSAAAVARFITANAGDGAAHRFVSVRDNMLGPFRNDFERGPVLQFFDFLRKAFPRLVAPGTPDDLIVSEVVFLAQKCLEFSIVELCHDAMQRR